MMEEIDREFQKGGRLFSRLDDSTPFRRKGSEKSIRARSWAIQDGILDEPWVSPKLYKTVGKKVGVKHFSWGKVLAVIDSSSFFLEFREYFY